MMDPYRDTREGPETEKKTPVQPPRYFTKPVHQFQILIFNNIGLLAYWNVEEDNQQKDLTAGLITGIMHFWTECISPSHIEFIQAPDLVMFSKAFAHGIWIVCIVPIQEYEPRKSIYPKLLETLGKRFLDQFGGLVESNNDITVYQHFFDSEYIEDLLSTLEIGI